MAAVNEPKRTELWQVRSVIRKRSAMEPADVARHVIDLEAEVVALRQHVELAQGLVEEALDTWTWPIQNYNEIRPWFKRLISALSEER